MGTKRLSGGDWKFCIASSAVRASVAVVTHSLPAQEIADETGAAGGDARRDSHAGSRSRDIRDIRDTREEKSRREGGSQAPSRTSTASNLPGDVSNLDRCKSKGSGARLWRAIIKGLCQVHTAVPGTVPIRHIM